MNKTALIGSIAGIVLGISAGETLAQTTHENHSSATVQTNQFQRIEQPLGNKVAVTFGGLGIIGLQLWWFLLSKPKSQKAVATGGNIQEVNITVDGGYDPSRILVQAGKPVRLKFERKDPSSCLEQVIIPDFHIAADLPINQITTVEFTPEQAGTYLFTCGMNMFRGEIHAETSDIQSTVTKEDKTMIEPQPQALSLIDEQEIILEQKSQQAVVMVDQGYTPNRIVVQAGRKVKLDFLRGNPSNCLAKVLIPDFGIAADLPLNKLTSIEFTPEKPGEYAFTCGMNMFRGAISVQAANGSEEITSTKINFS
ncbi:cupredoxin domain-containing protein (plasmid) [Aphanizomenon flos-aquae CCAP 1446/1C]|nr:cupredoxin domain-containing protein [Anabaena sp. CCAP 1446/1C]MBY5308132.1 cupredoxin domain-containing protein [Anabaena sp. CCAP 1446/1C]